MTILQGFHFVNDFTFFVLKGQTNHTVALCAQCTRCKAGHVESFFLGNHGLQHMTFGAMGHTLHNCAVCKAALYEMQVKLDPFLFHMI